MKTKRSKATDISQAVKKTVWERDNGACVICGNRINVMPNCHFISRQNGGLGIEENIVTACTRLTPTDCHHRYDNGTKEERKRIAETIRNYLKSKYPDWNEEDLYYKKYNF